jgi:hypothetical protein
VDYEHQKKTYDVTDADLDSLAKLGFEATVLFSIAACATAVAVGLWFSVDPSYGSAAPNSVSTTIILYGAMPLVSMFAVISAVLGILALRRHRESIRDIKDRSSEPQEFIVRKDGMDVLNPPQGDG